MVAEAGSDILLPATIDDDGAEGFVETLRVVGGLEEETAVRGVVHGRKSECDRSVGPWNVSGGARRARIVYGEREVRRHDGRCRPYEMEAGIRKDDQRGEGISQDDEVD